MRIRTLSSLVILAAAPLAAQLAAPNTAGVAAGHIHLYVPDIDAEKQFFSQLGGTPVNNEKLQMVQFPGIFIVLRKVDSANPGTVGSVVNHFGFHVRSLDEWMPKWKAAGFKIEPAPNNPKQFFLTAPNDVRVEIIEDPSLPTPVAMHHIHLFVPDPKAAQAWYGEHFGAVAGKRGPFDTANVPGAEITLAKADTPQAPTKGRTLDHIGFEVKNIDQYVKKLEAEGIHTEAAIRTSPNASHLRIAFLTDPWGTYIELTEGLTPVPATSSSR